MGSYFCMPNPYVGWRSALCMIFCVSYKINPPNNIRPPYSATEYRPAPKAVVGGRNIVAILEANTTPKPMANGPPIYKNFSNGQVLYISFIMKVFSFDDK